MGRHRATESWGANLSTRLIKYLGRTLCFLLACGLLVVTASQFQHFAGAHLHAAFYLLASTMLLVPGGILALAAGYLIEASMVGWSRSSLKALRESPASVRLDALCMIMAVLPFRIPAYILSFGLILAIDKHLLEPSNISLTRFLPTWGVQIACVLVLRSFASYWMHRLEHAIPAFWALHKFHHSADRLSIMTAVRQTELSKGLEEMLLVFFLALLTEPLAAKPGPASPLYIFVAIYFFYRSFIRVNQYLVHSNLTTDYGWIGRWVLVSPRMHRLHHAADPQYHDKNFTFDLVIWDRLFGTYATCDPAADVKEIPLGLSDTPFNSGRKMRYVLRDYFLTPYVVFWQELRRGFSAWVPGSRKSPAHPA